MHTPLSILHSLLIDQQLDAALLSSSSNIYYLSGFVCISPEEQEAFVLVTRQHAYLFVSQLSSIDAHNYAKGLIIRKTSREKSFEQLIADVVKEEKIGTIGIEEHNLTVAEYRDLSDYNVKLEHMNLRLLRIRKNTKEIAAIEKACAIGDKAFDHVLSIIKPGITEEDLAVELELFVKKHHASLSFPSIIAFESHAAVPHHITGKTLLQKNQCILMDFGVKVDEYCSDMTRTVFFGQPTNEEKKVYNTVKEAQEKSIHYVTTTMTKEGKLPASQIDQQARDYITNKGYADFPHCSHGIGLEIHEAPSLSTYSKDTIANGMVFSIEPGIYMKNHMGVRIEDLMVVEHGQARLLTHSSRELIVI